MRKKNLTITYLLSWLGNALAVFWTINFLPTLGFEVMLIATGASWGTTTELGRKLSEAYWGLSSTMYLWIDICYYVAYLTLGIIVLSGCRALLERRRRAQLPGPLSEPVETDHGQDLETVMEAIRYEEVEFTATFDREGSKICEYTNYSPETVMTISDFGMSGTIHIHNHPGVQEGSFSSTDIENLLRNRFFRTIVVTPCYTYTLTNPNWAEGPLADLGKIKRYYDKTFCRRVIDEWAAGSDALFSSRLYRRLVEKAVRRMAEDYGLIYEVQNHAIEQLKAQLRYFLRPKRLAMVIGCILAATPLIWIRDTSVSSAMSRDSVETIIFRQEQEKDYERLRLMRRVGIEPVEYFSNIELTIGPNIVMIDQCRKVEAKKVHENLTIESPGIGHLLMADLGILLDSIEPGSGAYKSSFDNCRIDIEKITEAIIEAAKARGGHIRSYESTRRESVL